MDQLATPGLCFRAPGVGKTLSARHYSRTDLVKESGDRAAVSAEAAALDTVFYTPSVVNTPRTIDFAISRSRDFNRNLARRPLRIEKEERLRILLERDEDYKYDALWQHDWFTKPIPELRPTYGEVALAYAKKEMKIAGATARPRVGRGDHLDDGGQLSIAESIANADRTNY